MCGAFDGADVTLLLAAEGVVLVFVCLVAGLLNGAWCLVDS